MGGYGYGGSLGSYHFAGQRNGAIGIFEDGVNGEQTQGLTTIKPVQNSVEEVKVLTTTLPAEYGHSAGGVISVVKKSGTNQLHGLASDFGRTRNMQHRLFFDNLKTSDPRPGFPNGLPTWFMMPEANVSGPVFIPKVSDGRNKTFFFFGYQKLIEKKAAQVINQYAHSSDEERRPELWRRGLPDLRSLHDAAGQRELGPRSGPGRCGCCNLQRTFASSPR